MRLSGHNSGLAETSLRQGDLKEAGELAKRVSGKRALRQGWATAGSAAGAVGPPVLRSSSVPGSLLYWVLAAECSHLSPWLTGAAPLPREAWEVAND